LTTLIFSRVLNITRWRYGNAAGERMNDKLCLEHSLSIVEKPKPNRHRRWRPRGFGDMSPTSILEGFAATGNPLKYAILRKIALLAGLGYLYSVFLFS
jgi:hypothetical protein